MRILVCLVLLLASVSVPAQTGAPTQTGQPGPVENPQEPNVKRARELVDKAIEALGGQRYFSVVDISTEGRAYGFYKGETNDIGTRYWAFWKSPDKERTELTKQRDIIYIQNGEQGFETTFRGTRPRPAKEVQNLVRRRQYSLRRMLRDWVSQPNVSLYYEGVAVAENKPAEKITISIGNGQAQILYLDKFSSLPIAKSFTFRDPETRERIEELEGYDNYHMVQGVNTPYTVTNKRNGEMVSQIFITKIVYNSGLQDSLFSPRVTYDPEAKKRQNP